MKLSRKLKYVIKSLFLHGHFEDVLKLIKRLILNCLIRAFDFLMDVTALYTSGKQT